MGYLVAIVPLEKVLEGGKKKKCGFGKKEALLGPKGKKGRDSRGSETEGKRLAAPGTPVPKKDREVR